MYPKQIQNIDLGWEKNTQYNVGVDASMWKGLLGLSLDLYYTKTTDMLFDVPVPSASGFTSSNMNIYMHGISSNYPGATAVSGGGTNGSARRRAASAAARPSTARWAARPSAPVLTSAAR